MKSKLTKKYLNPGLLSKRDLKVYGDLHLAQDRALKIIKGVVIEMKKLRCS